MTIETAADWGEAPGNTTVATRRLQTTRPITMTAPAPSIAIRRRATAVIAGALLLLLVAQPVLAVEWGPAIRLSSMDNYLPRIFRTGPTSALTVYQRGSYAYARR